jgi:16S rRNA (guanine1207-N2)-methyltransferase
MEAKIIHAKLKGYDLAFVTRAGVFSKHRIDPGSQLLIETAEIGAKDRILDIGCGYGPIGITGAKIATEGSVIMIDDSIRAIRLARENIKINHVKNAEATLSDGLEEVTGNKFTLILANPPSSAGLTIFEEFAEGAKKLLENKGRIYFVTQDRFKPVVKRIFENVYGNCDFVVRSKGYIVSVASKNDSRLDSRLRGNDGGQG